MKISAAPVWGGGVIPNSSAVNNQQGSAVGEVFVQIQFI